MNNTNESIGLRVLDVSPDNRSSNVNVNSDIKITFTADINPQTFIKNIVVLKDYNHIFKDINSLKDLRDSCNEEEIKVHLIQQNWAIDTVNDIAIGFDDSVNVVYHEI